ncbi:diguanylate cyclase domain-containing protein [Rhodoblastus sp.]|uniref:diguanylate cyclase domain-containing protein n=1 Tax=Rhodoblastus sp. TaxID=1962975 RepID=UPI0035B0E8F2
MSGMVDVNKPASAPPDSRAHLEAQLLKGPHADMTTIISGAIFIPILYLYASYHQGQTTLVVIAGISLIAGLVRVATSLLYRKFATSENIGLWKAVTHCVIIAFGASLGLFTYVAIAQTDDYRLQFVAGILAAGYAAGSVSLNATVQAGFPMTAFAAVIPAGIALAQHGDPLYRMLAIQVALFLVAMRMTSKATYDQMVSMWRSDEEKAHLLQAITEKSERFDTALSNMPQGLAMFETDRRVVVANSKFRDLLGLPAGENDPPIDVLFELSARNGVLSPESVTTLIGMAHDSANNNAQQAVEIDTIDGQTLEITFQPMSRGGSVVIVTDVTQKRALDRITHLAHHDILTDLPNRMFFEQHFAATLDAAKKDGGRIAVMALDLDRFKAVNDTLGHRVGDRLLKAVAKRIQSRLRAEDFAARVGGDEFILIHANAIGDSAERLARRLIELISEPYDIDGEEIVVGLTVGIARFPEDGADADALLHNADAALYHAKNAGRGMFHLFDKRLATEAGLRKAG